MKYIFIAILLFTVSCAPVVNHADPINKGMGVNSGWAYPSK